MLNLIVIRSVNPPLARACYEALGLSFVEEQHGNGPKHYACEMANGTVFEIYPLREGDVWKERTTGTILGLEVDVDLYAVFEQQRSRYMTIEKPVDGKATARDFDGHKLFLTQKPKIDQDAEIERVARAISRARLLGDYGEEEFEQEGELDRAVDGTWFRCCSEARAAIEAVRCSN